MQASAFGRKKKKVLFCINLKEEVSKICPNTEFYSNVGKNHTYLVASSPSYKKRFCFIDMTYLKYSSMGHKPHWWDIFIL